MVDAENIYKSYGKAAYLNNIRFHIDKGSALAVVGENGVGKTTLLKILATVAAPDSGSLCINDVDAIKNPADVRQIIGYVPQGIALMRELSVADNLQYWMNDKSDALFTRTLGMLGLEDVANKKVSVLSGGMQRRLNIGVALVLNPQLLILDEPLAGVDRVNRQKIITYLIDMKKSGMTMVFTSHYIEEMKELADSVISL